MSVLFLELARIVLFLSSSPHTFRLRMISSMLVLAPHGEVGKNSSCLPEDKFIEAKYTHTKLNLKKKNYHH